jgi:hypothetical protein
MRQEKCRPPHQVKVFSPGKSFFTRSKFFSPGKSFFTRFKFFHQVQAFSLSLTLMYICKRNRNRTITICILSTPSTVAKWFIFSNQTTNFGTFWEGSRKEKNIFYDHLVYFVAILFIFWQFWYNLWHSVVLSPFWYIVSRKIWQPWLRVEETFLLNLTFSDRLLFPFQFLALVQRGDLFSISPFVISWSRKNRKGLNLTQMWRRNGREDQGDQIGRIFAHLGGCLLWAVFWTLQK